jgi:GNAT superfamily N-acetyltransferase
LVESPHRPAQVSLSSNRKAQLSATRPNNLLHRTPQTVTIFAEQKYAPVCYAGEQGVRHEMIITFPTAEKEDSPYTWQLYRKAMRIHIEKIWGWDEAWQLADFEDKLNANDTVLVVCDSNKVGYLQYSFDESKIYINMIVLDSKSRSKGLGNAILSELNLLYPQRVIELRCFKVNIKAHAFYVREGFIIIDVEDNSYLMRKTNA